MRKLRQKLAHVVIMPHSWINYMLKQRGKRRPYPCNKRSSQFLSKLVNTTGGPHQKKNSSLLISSKPNDIHFPTTPRKVSWKTCRENPSARQASIKQETSRLHSVDICAASADTPKLDVHRSLYKCTISPDTRKLCTGFGGDDQSFKTHYSIMHSNKHLPSNAPPSHLPPHLITFKGKTEKSFHLNVMELNIKLRALSSYERWKGSYISPVVSVAAVPSPSLDDDAQEDLLDASDHLGYYPLKGGDECRRFEEEDLYEKITRQRTCLNDKSSLMCVWERGFNSLDKTGDHDDLISTTIKAHELYVPWRASCRGQECRNRRVININTQSASHIDYPQYIGASCSKKYMPSWKASENTENFYSFNEAETGLEPRTSPLEEQSAAQQCMQDHVPVVEDDDPKTHLAALIKVPKPIRITAYGQSRTANKDSAVDLALTSDSGLNSQNYRRFKLLQKGKLAHRNPIIHAEHGIHSRVDCRQHATETNMKPSTCCRSSSCSGSVVDLYDHSQKISCSGPELGISCSRSLVVNDPSRSQSFGGSMSVPIDHYKSSSSCSASVAIDDHRRSSSSCSGRINVNNHHQSTSSCTQSLDIDINDLQLTRGSSCGSGSVDAIDHQGNDMKGMSMYDGVCPIDHDGAEPVFSCRRSLLQGDHVDNEGDALHDLCVEECSCSTTDRRLQYGSPATAHCQAAETDHYVYYQLNDLYACLSREYRKKLQQKNRISREKSMVRSRSCSKNMQYSAGNDRHVIRRRCCSGALQYDEKKESSTVIERRKCSRSQHISEEVEARMIGRRNCEGEEALRMIGRRHCSRALQHDEDNNRESMFGISSRSCSSGFLQGEKGNEEQTGSRRPMVRRISSKRAAAALQGDKDEEARVIGRRRCRGVQQRQGGSGGGAGGGGGGLLEANVMWSRNMRADFKESMMEVVMSLGGGEEEGRSSCAARRQRQGLGKEEMVEILDCYLALNPTTHHPTIVNAFAEVWSHLFQFKY